MLHSPFFGSGKLEYYLAAQRPALEVRVDLRARRKPAPLLLETRPGLPALLAAPGRQALLLQSPPQQRPLALSSVRRLQRPPTNVTVRHQDALAYLRALPRQAPRQARYDPPYIF